MKKKKNAVMKNVFIECSEWTFGPKTGLCDFLKQQVDKLMVHFPVEIWDSNVIIK